MTNADGTNRRNLSLQFNRLIPATAEQVFEAWTNPDLLVQWLVISMTMPPAEGYASAEARSQAEQSCVTVRLFEAISGTTLTLDHEGFQSDESLQMHHRVWDSSLTKLRELFSGGTTDRGSRACTNTYATQ